MKLFIIYFIVCLCVLISCNKDEENADDNAEFATAILNGTESFVASKDTNEITFLRATLDNNGLEIMARQDMPNNKFTTVRIFINDYVGPGTYYSGIEKDDIYNVYIAFGGVSGTRYYSDYRRVDYENFRPGIFTITKDDGVVIEGTFDFIGFNSPLNPFSFDVTKGKFKMGFGIYP